MVSCISSAMHQQVDQENVQRELAGGGCELGPVGINGSDGVEGVDGENYQPLLNFQEYQAQANEFARYDRASFRTTYPIIGLAGEVGELANKWKKVIRDAGGELSAELRADLSKELGDCLWYVSAVATDLSLNLANVAQENLDKLNSRKERGTLAGSGDNR